MPWINLKTTARGSYATPTLHLFAPEANNVNLAIGVWHALGSPDRLDVLYDPDTRRVAIRAADAHGGYNVKPFTHGNSADRTPSSVRILCAAQFRKLLTLHGHAWPDERMAIPLVQEGELWIGQMPALDAPKATQPFLAVRTRATA